jgi:hypothetical protein
MSADIEKGVWYYGGIGGVDHLDYCGIPDNLGPLRTVLNIEFRYEIWRKIFQRIKLLKFD